ncbi:cytochrome P450 [Xylaria palmicola]|nr:cytochrome P450 [Xylaria palmicola]
MTGEWATQGYAIFAKRNIPYVVPTLDRGRIVILPPEQLKTVYKLPEDQLDVFGTLQEQIRAAYTVRYQRVVHDPYHRHLIPSQLTKNLALFTNSMIGEIKDEITSSWGINADWTEVPIWRTCFRTAARVSNTALYGTVLCRDERYLQSPESQTTAFFGGSLLISMTPMLFRPIVGYFVHKWCAYYSRKIAKICAPHIERRVRETTKNVQAKEGKVYMKGGLQIVIDEECAHNHATQLSSQLIADRLLMTNNVTLNGVTFTIHHLILCLISSNPTLRYIETIRDECATALQEAGEWGLAAVRRLKLLDSAIRESLRIAPFSSVAMVRTVIDPGGISIEHGKTPVTIPYGATLVLPVERIHSDEEHYSDAQTFNAFRFVDLDPHSSSPNGRRNYTTISAATTADRHFFGFGTSKNPCPGRFIAVHEIKLIMAYILLSYDLEYAYTELRCTDLLAMRVPKMDVTLQVRRRTSDNI